MSHRLSVFSLIMMGPLLLKVHIYLSVSLNWSVKARLEAPE